MLHQDSGLIRNLIRKGNMYINTYTNQDIYTNNYINIYIDILT